MIQETKSTRWPIDYETLQKGDVIDRDKLEHLTGKRFGTKEYDFAIMPIALDIQQAMYTLDKPVVCKIEKGRILILTDMQAIDYLHGRMDSNRKEHKRLIEFFIKRIDRNLLTPDKIKEYDKYGIRYTYEWNDRITGYKKKIHQLDTVDTRPKLV